jgi:hypothetical protein
MANHHLHTRRSPLSQSRTLFMGMDVHTETIAVAYVAQDHGAAGTSLSSLGPRQCDLAKRIRTRPAPANPRLFLYDAGPCGDWRSCSLTQKGDACWEGTPSLLPQTPGERGNTDRRDAVPLARLARSGARTPV